MLAGALPLFLGVLLNDLAYASTYQVQWKNFASWLLVGGLTVSFVVVLCALVDVARYADDRGPWRMSYVALLLVTWIVGYVNALVHAGDAWGSMPGGLILSIITALLALITTWLGFSNYYPPAGHAGRARTLR